MVIFLTTPATVMVLADPQVIVDPTNLGAIRKYPVFNDNGLTDVPPTDSDGDADFKHARLLPDHERYTLNNLVIDPEGRAALLAERIRHSVVDGSVSTLVNKYSTGETQDPSYWTKLGTSLNDPGMYVHIADKKVRAASTSDRHAVADDHLRNTIVLGTLPYIDNVDALLAWEGSPSVGIQRSPPLSVSELGAGQQAMPRSVVGISSVADPNSVHLALMFQHHGARRILRLPTSYYNRGVPLSTLSNPVNGIRTVTKYNAFLHVPGGVHRVLVLDGKVVGKLPKNLDIETESLQLGDVPLLRDDQVAEHGGVVFFPPTHV